MHHYLVSTNKKRIYWVDNIVYTVTCDIEDFFSNWMGSGNWNAFTLSWAVFIGDVDQVLGRYLSRSSLVT